MLNELSLFPEQASSQAARVDALFFYILAIVVFFTVLVNALMITFAIKYRRKSPDDMPTKVVGSTRIEVGGIVVLAAIALSIFFWSAWVYFDLFRVPPDALEVYVVGKQWMWKVQHPDGQREINQLHVPVNRPVKVRLTSEDVIHSFFVPAFRVKHDAVPGRYTETWFRATKPGTYHLFCTEFCGTWHSKMVGQVVVLPEEEYQAWLNGGSDGSLATAGRQLFLQLQCVACHAGGPEMRAPSLENLFGKTVPLADGRVAVADETYLRRSIVEPKADVVAGFAPIMPAYKDQVSEEDLIRLVAFLKFLPTGGTPPRVEETPPVPPDGVPPTPTPSRDPPKTPGPATPRQANANPSDARAADGGPATKAVEQKNLPPQSESK